MCDSHVVLMISWLNLILVLSQKHSLPKLSALISYITMSRGQSIFKRAVGPEPVLGLKIRHFLQDYPSTSKLKLFHNDCLHLLIFTFAMTVFISYLLEISALFRMFVTERVKKTVPICVLRFFSSVKSLLHVLHGNSFFPSSSIAL